MDNEKMSVSLVADITDFETKIKTAQKKIIELEKEMKKLANESKLKVSTGGDIDWDYQDKLRERYEMLEAEKKKWDEIAKSAREAQIASKQKPTTGSGGSSGSSGSSGGSDGKSGGVGSAIGKISLAMVGIRSLYSFVRKLVSQNENIQAAVQSLWESLGQALAPVFNVIAAAISGIVTTLNAFFGVGKETAKSTEKTSKSLASIDEINNLSSESEENTATEAFNAAETQIKNLFSGIVTLLMGVLNVAYGAVAATITSVVAVFDVVVATVWGVIKGVFDFITTWFGGLFTMVGNFFQTIADGIANGENIVVVLIKAVIGVARDAINTVLGSLNALFSGFINGFSTVNNWFQSKMIQPLKTWTENIWNTFKTNFAEPVASFFKKLWNNYLKPPVQSLLNGLGKIVNGFVSMVNSVISTINLIPGVNLGKMSYWSVPQLAVGTNYVPSDQLAMLHKGEAVIPKAFNEDQYNNSVETNALLKELIDICKNNGNVKIYLDSRKIANGINQQSRILGGSLV